MLVICPTPIGNLEEVTERQRRWLTEADMVACEDTRRCGKLMEHLGIDRSDGRPKLVRYDDHASEETVEYLSEAAAGDQAVVLVSDAGTPTISDPGYRLVQRAREWGAEVRPLSGPVAAMVALSASGLASDRFYFEGFLPPKEGARQKRLKPLLAMEATVIFYESPRRVKALLRELAESLGGERRVCVARELTKRHEEIVVATATEIHQQWEGRESGRGEFVVLVEGASGRDQGDVDWERADRLIEALLEQGLRSRTIKEVVDAVEDVPRSQIYDRINALKD